MPAPPRPVCTIRWSGEVVPVLRVNEERRQVIVKLPDGQILCYALAEVVFKPAVKEG